MTGYVNAHTHLYSGLVRFGMPEPDPPPANFAEILARVWWRLDCALTPGSIRAAARYYAADAARRGTVALVDHHESPHALEGSLDIVADACEEFGLGAIVCYGTTERNGGLTEAARGLEECRRFIRDNRRPGIRGVIGLHAPFTVSDATIREAGRLCRVLRTVLHVHVAEDRIDVDDARERGYEGPVDRLARLDALVPGSILAHGVHLSGEEVRQAEAAGCWFVQNPRSNRHNRVGYAAVLDGSGRVALGTDGFPSDMPAEAAALAETATAFDGTVGHRMGRLAAGPRLIAQLLGPDWRPAVPAVDPVRFDAVERAAREEAGRLWERMNGNAWP